MADNRKFCQGQDYFLSGAGTTSTATSIILTSFQTPDGTNITMTDFGLLGYMTLEPETANEENISFTGVTQNPNGTATLTGVTRGLGFVAPYTASLSLALAHPGGAKIRVTNSAPFYNEFTNKFNDETILNTWTFNAVPQSTTAPVMGTDLANKTYVDSVVTGGATVSELIVPGTAQDTIAQGEFIYFDEGLGGWVRTDADISSTINDVLLGIAQGAGTAGFPIANGVLVKGQDTNQSGLTPNTKYYYSNTPGQITLAPGTFSLSAGIARTATDFYFEPGYDENVTATEVRNNAFTYAQDSGAANAYVITVSPAFSAYVAGQVFQFRATNANTTSSTLNVNGNGAISIKKNVTDNLTANDIKANEVVEVVYDGTNFQLISRPNQLKVPTVQVFNAIATTSFGDLTTELDITGGGSSWTYTWNGVGTDPGITALTIPTGSWLRIRMAGIGNENNGVFSVTASGNNFFTVTNADGNADSGTIGLAGSLEKMNSQTYTKPAGLTYAVVEVVGAGAGGEGANDEGGAGGGAGGYARKTLAASAIGTTETIYVGNGGQFGDVSGTNNIETGGYGFGTYFGSILSATGGFGGGINASNGDLAPFRGGGGGVGSGGDINSGGQAGNAGDASSGSPGGHGGSSVLGGGGYSGDPDTTGGDSLSYGGGGGGGSASGTSRDGGAGADGVIIVTEYYS
jgi:hypothetical protein